MFWGKVKDWEGSCQRGGGGDQGRGSEPRGSDCWGSISSCFVVGREECYLGVWVCVCVCLGQAVPKCVSS